MRWLSGVTHSNEFQGDSPYKIGVVGCARSVMVVVLCFAAVLVSRVLGACVRGGGADLTKIQPAGIRTKSGGARSIEEGKGPAGSGLSLGVAGVENGGRKDATFLRPPW